PVGPTSANPTFQGSQRATTFTLPLFTRGGTYTIYLNVTDTHKAPAPVSATLQVYVHSLPSSSISAVSWTPGAAESVITTGLSSVTISDNTLFTDGGINGGATWNVTVSSGVIFKNTSTTPDLVFTPTLDTIYNV